MTSNYELRVSESITAPATAVRTFLIDLSNFSQWNPFLVMDPQALVTVSEQTSGVGARYSWSSTRIGSGIMTITGVSDVCIDIHMQFTSRNKREGNIQWLLRETPGGTEATWVMSGQRSLGERVFVRLMRLDNVMLKHFADGLQQLKAAVEK
jgi:hypothetical protein